MYTDAMNYANSCPQSAIIEATGQEGDKNHYFSLLLWSVPSK